MKQGHYWIAGACVIGMGIGYVAGSIRGGDTRDADRTDPATRPTQTKSGSREHQNRGGAADDILAEVLKGRPPQDLNDDELVKIVRRLSEYDSTQSSVVRTRQAYQLQLLLAKLPMARLEQVAEAIAADPERRRSGGVSSIISAMATKDAQHAMEWAKNQENASYLLSSILATMAKDDPATAAEIYRDSLLQGTFVNNDGWSASYGIAAAMARLGKTPLLQFIDSLPKQQQGNILSNSLRELPESERTAMLDEIYQRSKDGRMQGYGFSNFFSNAISNNLAEAEAWLDKMESGKERASLELSAANTLSQIGNSDAAREWMSRAISNSPGREKELLMEAVNQMSYNNPGDIAVFARLLPEGGDLLADDLKSQAGHISYRGFSGLMGLAAAIRDPAEQAKLITVALNDLTDQTTKGSEPSRVNATDFEILSRQLETLNLNGENAAQVEDALAAARNATPKLKE